MADMAAENCARIWLGLTKLVDVMQATPLRDDGIIKIKNQ